MKYLYHIALVSDWENAKRCGYYDISTLGKKYADTGFIHLSYATQVNRVADAIYRGVDNLLLLKIEPSAVIDKIKNEAIGKDKEKFPHLYSILSIKAVIETTGYKAGSDGQFPIVSE
jgi:uncharacterized protein (DUF952 family)